MVSAAITDAIHTALLTSAMRIGKNRSLVSNADSLLKSGYNTGGK